MRKQANVVELSRDDEPTPYQSERTIKKATIRITVEGVISLMTHNPQAMYLTDDQAKRGSRIPEREVEAEAGAYRLDDGTCAIKSEAFVSSMVGKGGAAGAWKAKNRTTMKTILAHISSPTDLTALAYRDGKPIREYEIDVRPAVVQRARIIRARPKYKEWRATFDVEYDPALVGDPKIIVDILDDAGARIGVGDYRPRFGRFRVVEYQIMK